MKFQPPLEKAILLRRYKRFLADVELSDGSVITVHCPNTGSMQRCIVEGGPCWLSTSDNPKRKYRHTWEIATVPGGFKAGINTHRANALALEAINNGLVRELADYTQQQQEVRYGQENSRIDIFLSAHPADERDCYVEVKSVTLGIPKGLGLFPDAVSKRGTKHLRELMHIRASGCRAVLFFCVQHTGIKQVAPAENIDPEYAATLREAVAAGVEVIAYRAKISAREITLTNAVPVVTQ